MNYFVFIADFGESYMMKQAFLQQTNKSLKGNFLYQSPEVVKEQKPYTTKVDVFSIGLIIVEILLNNKLNPMDMFNFKQMYLSQIVPDIQNYQNYDFIEQIINYMANYQLNERLEPMKLLQKLKSFTVDQNSLKTLKLPNSNQNEILKQLPQQQIQQVEKHMNNQADQSSDGKQYFSKEVGTLLFSHFLNKKINQEQSLKFDQALFDKLIGLKSKEQVEITYLNNKLKNEEVLAIKEILSQCNQMKQIKLKFNNCELSDQQFMTIVSIFNKEELFQKLGDINLDFSFNKMIDSKSICNVISTFKNYKKLKQIQLWIGYLDLNFDILGTVSSTLEYLPDLSYLTLGFNYLDLTSDILVAISSILEHLANININTVFLSFPINSQQQQENRQMGNSQDKNKKVLEDKISNSLNHSTQQNLLRKVDIHLEVKNIDSLSLDFDQFLKSELFKNKQFSAKIQSEIIFNFKSVAFDSKEANINDLKLRSLQIQASQPSINNQELCQLFQQLYISIKFFQKLDLQIKRRFIQDQGAQLLSTFIEDCKQNILILRLDLMENKITNQGFSQISRSLDKCLNLSYLTLDVSRNNIDDQGVNEMTKFLKAKRNIINLNLNFGQNQIGDSGLKDLGLGLENCINLSNLTINLFQNKFGWQGVSDLGSSIGKLKSISDLNLDFSQNKIGSKGFQSLNSGIGLSENLTSLKLILIMCNIGDNQESNITKGLSQCLKLSSLIIELRENNMDEKQISDFATDLGDCINLESLDLNFKWNNIDNKGVMELAKILGKCQKLTTLKLNILKNKIQNEGIKHFSNELKNCVHLVNLELILDQNNIDQVGVIELYKNLAACQNLKAVNLNLKYIQDNSDGIQAINIQEDISYQTINALSINLSYCTLRQFIAIDLGLVQNLTSLNINLSQNKLSKLDYLANGLQKCLLLKNLDLNISDNEISDNQMIIFSTGLASCKFLNNLILQLRNTIISSEGAQSVIQALTNFENIKILKLDFNDNQIKFLNLNVLQRRCDNINQFTLLIEKQTQQYYQSADIQLQDWLINCQHLSVLTVQASYHYNTTNIRLIKRHLKRLVSTSLQFKK
ncbi:hypothetical protein ABPG73_008981 [Tetrahymena malaccensis]